MLLYVMLDTLFDTEYVCAAYMQYNWHDKARMSSVRHNAVFNAVLSRYTNNVVVLADGYVCLL